LYVRNNCILSSDEDDNHKILWGRWTIVLCNRGKKIFNNVAMTMNSASKTSATGDETGKNGTELKEKHSSSSPLSTKATTTVATTSTSILLPGTKVPNNNNNSQSPDTIVRPSLLSFEAKENKVDGAANDKKGKSRNNGRNRNKTENGTPVATNLPSTTATKNQGQTDESSLRKVKKHSVMRTQEDPLELTVDNSKGDKNSAVSMDDQVPSVNTADDDTSSSLCIDGLPDDENTKIECLVSDYHSYFSPAVYLKHYPRGDEDIGLPDTSTRGMNSTPSKKKTKDTTKKNSRTKTKSQVARKHQTPSQQQDHRSTLHAVPVPAVDATGICKRKAGGRLIVQPARIKKKVNIHETVIGQFDDANESQPPPAYANDSAHQDSKSSAGHPQNTHSLQQAHEYSNPQMAFTTAYNFPTVMGNNPSQSFHFSLQYNAAVLHAQQQQQNQLQLLTRQPVTPHEANILQADMDLVAAYQRVQALKGYHNFSG
jgi:hypothetical protein